MMLRPPRDGKAIDGSSWPLRDGEYGTDGRQPKDGDNGLSLPPNDAQEGIDGPSRPRRNGDGPSQPPRDDEGGY